MNQASSEPNGEFPIFGSAFIGGYVRAHFTFAKKVAPASVRPDELGAPCDPLAARTHRRPGRGGRGHDGGVRLSGGAAAGKLVDEIAPVKGENALVAVEGCVHETSPQKLVDLKLPFKAGGTVPAGTSSPLTDGTTGVFVCSESYVEERGFAPLARTRSFAMSGRAVSVTALGSIGSTCEVLTRAKLMLDDINIVKIIEAFVPPRPRDPRGKGHHRRRRDRARTSTRRALWRLVGKVSPLLKLEKDAMRWARQSMDGGMGIALELVTV